MADDFRRLYGGSLKHPLMRAMGSFVRKHLRSRWAPDWQDDIKHIDRHELHFEYLSRFRQMADNLQTSYDKVFGPRISLEGPRDGIDLATSYVVPLDFDSGNDLDGCDLKLPTEFEWTGSAFDRAGRSYQRECGWDFSPGVGGIWLTSCVLTSYTGAGNSGWYHGNLVGFVILYDRDDDGKYESVGHLWTAEIARRKGISRQLLESARRDFPVTRIEQPYTKSGAALIKAVWPDKALER